MSHIFQVASSCDSYFWARLNLGKRKRESYGKDCEEEGEAGPQGQGEADHAFGQRPSRREARSSGRSQDQGSPSSRGLSREDSIRHQARPDDRSAASGRSFFDQSFLAPPKPKNIQENNCTSRACIANSASANRGVELKFCLLPQAVCRKCLNSVDLSPHRALKVRIFKRGISFRCQQNTCVCSLSGCSN